MDTALLAVAIPILPGKRQRWEKFIEELKTNRSNEFRESRRRLKVRERTFLEATPQGDFVIVTLEGDDPAAAFGQFGAAGDDFTNWFVAEVKEIHAVDLRQPPEGPLPELLIDSEAG